MIINLRAALQRAQFQFKEGNNFLISFKDK